MERQNLSELGQSGDDHTLNPLVLLVLFAMALLVLGKGLVVYAERIIRTAVTDRHREGESILDSGNPPQHWLHARPWWHRRGDDAKVKVRFAQRAKTGCLAKLDKSIKYFENCQFFASEEDRQYMLEQMQRVRRNWEKRPASRFQKPRRP